MILREIFEARMKLVMPNVKDACLSGCIKMVFTHYGLYNKLSAEKIHSLITGGFTYTDKSGRKVEVKGSLGALSSATELLKFLEIPCKRFKVTEESVRDAIINQGKPIIVGIKPDGQYYGHAIVVFAVFGDEVRYLDPDPSANRGWIGRLFKDYRTVDMATLVRDANKFVSPENNQRGSGLLIN